MDWDEGNKDALWVFEYIDSTIKYDEITDEIYDNDTILNSLPFLNVIEMRIFVRANFDRRWRRKNKLPLLKEVQNNKSLLLNVFLSNWISSPNSKNQIVSISY